MMSDIQVTTRPVSTAAVKARLIERRAQVAERIIELSDPDTEHADDVDVDGELRALIGERGSLDMKLDAVALSDSTPTVDQTPAPADPGLIELRSRAQLEGVMHYAIDHDEREARGAVGEYLTERYGRTRGNNGGVLIPWDWTDDYLQARRKEDRADTTYSTVAGPEMGHTIYPRVLAHRGAVAALGLMPMMTSYGTYSFDYLTTTASNGVVTTAATEGTRPTAPAYGVSEVNLAPGEIAAAADITARAMNLAGGRLEQSIIADMQEDMMVYLERAAIDDIVGTSGITTNAAPSSPAATFITAIGTVNKIIDGIYASRVDECRFVCNPDIFEYLANLYSNSNREDRSAWDKLTSSTADHAVTPHMAPVASNVGNILYRRGMHSGAFRWVVWDAAELVVNHWTHGGMKTELTLRTAYAMDTETTNRKSFVLAGVRTGT